MHIVIAGGSGFVGGYLSSHLVHQGHQVTILTHSDLNKIQARLFKHYKNLNNSLFQILDYERYTGDGDVLINFAGESLGARPVTSRRMPWLSKSRLAVIDKLSSLEKLPAKYIQASAVALYPNQDEEQDESSPILSKGESGFADIALMVEERAQKLNEQFNFQKFYILRFGLVLHRSGGIMKKASFMPPFTIMQAQNKLAFIELTDASRALIKLCETNVFPSGVINFTAPNPVTLKELLHCCYKHSSLPQIPVMTGLLRLGDRRVQLIQANQVITPKVLLDNGFSFKHPSIDQVE